jgi:inner membrane protein
MLLFAHTGIALGAATVVAGIANKQEKVSWFVSLTKYMDARLLMVGAMLPDIIDKPVGQYFFRETFENGRIFSHTLLFLLILTGIGFYLLKAHRQAWMLTLAAGTAMHLILDQMWTVPRTLFWPLMGFQFPPENLEVWATEIVNAVTSNPQTYIPEVIGLVILLWFGVVVIKRKQAGSLLKTGRIS